MAPDAARGHGPSGALGRARAAALQADVAGDRSAEWPDVPSCFRKPRPGTIPEGAGNNNPKADSWEDFSYYIRCITPRRDRLHLPGDLWQRTSRSCKRPGYVTIMQEMVHEARVIPLDGRPHASPNIRSYMGDARGHWEGNTLVVETTNFLGNKTGIGRQWRRHSHQRRPETDRALYARRVRTRCSTK